MDELSVDSVGIMDEHIITRAMPGKNLFKHMTTRCGVQINPSGST